MSKEDMYRQNKEIKIKLVNRKFQKAFDLLKHLRTKYTVSKDYGPFRLYSRLKKMIEEVLEGKNLNPQLFM